jgi:hypothetical protein
LHSLIDFPAVSKREGRPAANDYLILKLTLKQRLERIVGQRQ